jgi:putative DNA primase/helicase
VSDHWNEGWSESTIEGALVAKAKEERDTARRDHVRALAYKIGVLGETDLDLLAEARQILGGNGAGPSDDAAQPASTLIDFTDVIAKPVKWAWRDRIALGKLTALSGRPKVGKGLLYSDLIARATRGELEGDLDGPRNAIIVTTEDDPGDTLKPRLMAANAALERVSFFRMGTKDEPVPFRVPEHAEELGRRIAQKHAAFVVIDPLVEFIDGKLDSHKSQAVRQALASLNSIAREQGCAVPTVIHLNKGASTDPLLRQEASAAFTQVVRGGLLLGHDPQDPDGDSGDQRVLAVSASNLAAIAPSLVYRIETRRVVGDTGEEITTAGVVCIGESSADGHDLLRGQGDPDERADRDEAVEFLEAELAEGARPAGEVQTAARKAGIGPWPLKRAKRELGVDSNKRGMDGGWWWELPEGDDPKGMTRASENPSPSSPSAFQAVSEGSQGDEIPEGDASGSPSPSEEFFSVDELLRSEDEGGR